MLVQGTPADVAQGNEKQVIDSLLEQYKHFSNDLKFSKREKLIRSLAWQQSIKAGRQLSQKEMEALVEDLFKCKQPNASPDGNPTYLEFKKEQLRENVRPIRLHAKTLRLKQKTQSVILTLRPIFFEPLRENKLILLSNSLYKSFHRSSYSSG